VVRCTFSPARAWRPAVVARLARTLGLTNDPRQHSKTRNYSLAAPTHRSENLSGFKKTRWMNLAGGAGLTVTGIALLLNKAGNQTFGVLALIVALYAFMVFAAFGTARALLPTATGKHRRVMLIVNWAFIALYSVGIVITVIATFGSLPVLTRMLLSLVPGALAFVVPQAVNIRALKALVATETSEA
jgi:hypothetical protein